MPGIRIRHPKERHATFTLVDGRRPYVGGPILCSRCGRHHEFKTYHIDLDGEGAGIVSIEVWERLKSIKHQPFILEGEVKDPPARVLDLRAGSNQAQAMTPVVAHEE